jgi:hypothetical protein
MGMSQDMKFICWLLNGRFIFLNAEFIIKQVNKWIHLKTLILPPQSEKLKIKQCKYKGTPVTSCVGPSVSETSRLPHFLENRLTDGGVVVSLMRRTHFTPRKIPGTHFC